MNGVSMLELEYGKVKTFNETQGKRFGFLKVCDKFGVNETGEEIFFHFNDGQFVEIVGDDIQFIGRIFRYPDGTTRELRYPSINDLLAFERGLGKNDQQKAVPWTLAEAYTARVRTLLKPHYRLVEMSDESDDLKCIWEGYGIDRLPDQYSFQVREGQIFDPLSVDTVLRFFQELVAEVVEANDTTGTQEVVHRIWDTCPDPRDRTGVIRRIKALVADDPTANLDDEYGYAFAEPVEPEEE